MQSFQTKVKMNNGASLRVRFHRETVISTSYTGKYPNYNQKLKLNYLTPHSHPISNNKQRYMTFVDGDAGFNV